MQYDTFCSFVSLVWLFSVWLSGCGSDELSAVPSRVIITSSSPSQSSYRSSSLPPYPVSFYWSEDKYPNPRDDPFGCRQPRSSLLCDPDQILDANQAQLIRDLLEQNRRSTKCFCEKCPSGEAGIKVAVALARNIDDTQYGDSSSQQFADHLRQKWRYSLCNDSLLLLMIQSYPAPKSSITTSLGRIAERLFPHQFFAEIVQNISIITETTTMSNNGLGVNVVHGDNHFQLLRSMLTAITDHVEQIADPSIYQRDDHQLLAMSAVSDTDSRNSNTAIIIVAVTTGFIFFLALIVGTILIVKRRFQQEPDSELPEMDPPLGYQMVPNTARKSLVPVTVDDDDHDEIDHDNNNDNDDNGSNNDEPPPTHILGDEMTPRS